jgi:molecular chaperone GrpE
MSASADDFRQESPVGPEDESGDDAVSRASSSDSPFESSETADLPDTNAPTALAEDAGPEGGEGTEEAEGLAENGHVAVQRDLEELAAKAEKADEYLVLAQRTKADFENYRKRASREAALAQDRGIAKLAKELLPAIDNLDRAVQAAETFGAGSPEQTAGEAESQLASGIRLVHADVLAALGRVGIEPFSPAGENFDPQFHEAVAQHPVEGAESGTVIEVYQQGYRLGETVLRPARVLVAA